MIGPGYGMLRRIAVGVGGPGDGDGEGEGDERGKEEGDDEGDVRPLEEMGTTSCVGMQRDLHTGHEGCEESRCRSMLNKWV
jgi:hypothetical protein